MTIKPNLFSYATSELSQDAFICWLLAWAGEADKGKESALHQVSIEFLSALFKKSGRLIPSVIDSIKVERQVDGIDILCTVNGDIAVLIEDKVGTREHSGQLDRYLKSLSGKGWSDTAIIPIYLQTGDQSSYNKVRGSAYHAFLRRDFIQVLESDAGIKARAISDILADYYEYLFGIERAVESYLEKPVEAWGRRAWQGFYQFLQLELGTGEWKYVANPSGGFLCFHWYHRDDASCQQYLQLEEKTLCLKIAVNDPKERRALRSQWHKRVTAACLNTSIKVERPSRFGSGRTMTVGIVRDYRVVDENGLIDIPKTVSVLLAAQALLDGTKYLSNA